MKDEEKKDIKKAITLNLTTFIDDYFNANPDLKMSEIGRTLFEGWIEKDGEAQNLQTLYAEKNTYIARLAVLDEKIKERVEKQTSKALDKKLTTTEEKIIRAAEKIIEARRLRDRPFDCEKVEASQYAFWASNVGLEKDDWEKIKEKVKEILGV